MACILADGGTEDQIKLKTNVLLNKIEKTPEMLEVENTMREFIRELFNYTEKDIIAKSNGDPFLKSVYAPIMLLSASRLIDEPTDAELSKLIAGLKELGNQNGISFSLIKNEEYDKALAKYK